MSYAIANIIYGIPWTDELYDLNESIGDDTPEWAESWLEESMFGFTELYSGCAERTVGYLGVRLGSFDECSDYFLLCDLDKYKPTDEQVLSVMKELEWLPEQVRSLCKPIGIYVVWSTS